MDSGGERASMRSSGKFTVRSPRRQIRIITQTGRKIMAIANSVHVGGLFQGLRIWNLLHSLQCTMIDTDTSIPINVIR
jgi:hypothetical protein